MVAAWLAVFGTGVFIVSFSAMLALLKSTVKQDWMEKLAKISSVRMVKLSDSLQKWVLRAERETGGIKIITRRGPLFLLFALLFSALGFFYGVLELHNPAAGIILAAAGIIFPEQFYFYRERAFREKLIEQMGAVVRVFAAEYAETPHPVKALGAASRKLPDPIGGILREAEKGLLLGKDKDDVLIELARKLDFEYGRLFVQLLRLSFEDEAVKPLFSRLAARISGQQDLIRKSRVEVTADRIMSLALNLAVVPVYLLMQKVVPEARSFFTDTVAGRGIVVCCLVSAVAGALLDRVVNRGDVSE